MNTETTLVTGLQYSSQLEKHIQVLLRNVWAILWAVFLTISSAAAIEKPRNINWDNLIPKMSKLDDPFKGLSNEQVMDLDFLISTENMRQQKFLSEVDEAFEEAIEIRYKLERQGLDVDGLISAFRQLEKEIEKRNKKMNTKINNKLVRIPGFALPLEHRGTAVEELLLVPYVGACIHVPPPPPNQTVYVKLNNAHSFNDLFEPVWITGRISIKATKQNLYLVDGSADVDTGYTLEGLRIEPYETE